LEKDLAKPPRGRGELVLAVDDEEDIRSFIQDVLQSHGYRVLSAAAGSQALGIYAEHWREIALVILDLVMPGMGGEDVFLKMKAINPGIKALLSTGYNQDGRAGRIIAQGISGFIQKPYDFASLLTILRRVLDGRG
jgi:DNA-binding NtrC family response regulator